MEPRRQLVCEAFILDEAVLARQSNSLFIEAFCVELRFSMRAISAETKARRFWKVLGQVSAQISSRF